MFEHLTHAKRIAPAKAKMERVLDHFLYVLELHASFDSRMRDWNPAKCLADVWISADDVAWQAPPTEVTIRPVLPSRFLHCPSARP